MARKIKKPYDKVMKMKRSYHDRKALKANSPTKLNKQVLKSIDRKSPDYHKLVQEKNEAILNSQSYKNRVQERNQKDINKGNEPSRPVPGIDDTAAGLTTNGKEKTQRVQLKEAQVDYDKARLDYRGRKKEGKGKTARAGIYAGAATTAIASINETDRVEAEKRKEADIAYANALKEMGI